MLVNNNSPTGYNMSKYGSLENLIEDGELVESDEEQVTLEETVNWQTIHRMNETELYQSAASSLQIL